MKIFIAFILIGFQISLHAQKEEEAFIYVEKMPEFPDGATAMYMYLHDNLRFPVEALKIKLNGQVVVQFVVDTTGTIQNVEVIRKIGYGCDEEAKRLVESMNDGHKWIPGSHKGHPVPVKFTLPIKFTTTKS